MITRLLTEHLLERLAKSPAVVILGARQVGKTTLSEVIMSRWRGKVVRFDLEDPDDVARLTDPKATLSALADHLVVIDELQRMPEIFPLLRVLIDRDRRPGRFLLLGSSSPDIIQRSGESLAGRVTFFDLWPLSLGEVGAERMERLWLRGGHPDLFLAETDEEANESAIQLLRAFTEQDLPLLGLGAPPTRTRDLLRMVAHSHGTPLNMSTFAKSLGVSVPAIRKYLDFFTQAYMAFELSSYQPNLRKRLIKAPKLYLTDSGLLHALLGIESMLDLRGHPVLGNSWEGFVIQQIRANLDARYGMYYFRTRDGSELDLVVVRGNRPVAALEIKTTNAPKLSRGNTVAFEAVGAPRNLIVTPGAADFPYREGITVCSLSTLWDHLP